MVGRQSNIQSRMQLLQHAAAESKSGAEEEVSFDFETADAWLQAEGVNSALDVDESKSEDGQEENLPFTQQTTKCGMVTFNYLPLEQEYCCDRCGGPARIHRYMKVMPSGMVYQYRIPSSSSLY